MLKRKYQPGGINERKDHVLAGNTSDADSKKQLVQKGFGLPVEKAKAAGFTIPEGFKDKLFVVSREELEDKINKGLIDRNDQDIKLSQQEIRSKNPEFRKELNAADEGSIYMNRDNALTYKGRGLTYDNGKLTTTQEGISGEVYDDDVTKEVGKVAKKHYGKDKTAVGNVLYQIFGSKKKAADKFYQDVDKGWNVYNEKGMTKGSNYPVTSNYNPTVEVDTPAQQPQTTPTDKKVDYEWKEFTNGNDPYKYRVALDKASGNPLMYEYSKDGKTWKQQEETDKGNRTMERQSVISNLWKNYQQNPTSMQPSQQRTTGRTGTGGSGRGGSRITTESQGSVSKEQYNESLNLLEQLVQAGQLSRGQANEAIQKGENTVVGVVNNFRSQDKKIPVSRLQNLAGYSENDIGRDRNIGMINVYESLPYMETYRNNMRYKTTPAGNTVFPNLRFMLKGQKQPINLNQLPSQYYSNGELTNAFKKGGLIKAQKGIKLSQSEIEADRNKFKKQDTKPKENLPKQNETKTKQEGLSEADYNDMIAIGLDIGSLVNPEPISATAMAGTSQYLTNKARSQRGEEAGWGTHLLESASTLASGVPLLGDTAVGLRAGKGIVKLVTNPKVKKALLAGAIAGVGGNATEIGKTLPAIFEKIEREGVNSLNSADYLTVMKAIQATTDVAQTAKGAKRFFTPNTKTTKTDATSDTPKTDVKAKEKNGVLSTLKDKAKGYYSQSLDLLDKGVNYTKSKFKKSNPEIKAKSEYEPLTSTGDEYYEPFIKREYEPLTSNVDSFYEPFTIPKQKQRLEKPVVNNKLKRAEIRKTKNDKTIESEPLTVSEGKVGFKPKSNFTYNVKGVPFNKLTSKDYEIETMVKGLRENDGKKTYDTFQPLLEDLEKIYPKLNVREKLISAHSKATRPSNPDTKEWEELVSEISKLKKGGLIRKRN